MPYISISTSAKVFTLKKNQVIYTRKNPLVQYIKEEISEEVNVEAKNTSVKPFGVEANYGKDISRDCLSTVMSVLPIMNDASVRKFYSRFKDSLKEK
ncbi:hypothetical protein GOP47_0028299 [Adiantum capillus-veneris]|nr:hypothetical protein GOP47_0028299 [Adiantum capillus-veneris]